MSNEILTMLFDHILLIEGVLLIAAFGVMLLKHRSNSRRREADHARDSVAPTNATFAGNAPVRSLRLVR